MAPLWAIFLAIIYSLNLLFVFSFSLAQLSLVYHYLFSKRNKNLPPYKIVDENLPICTIQLPIYNEMYVVERLFESISKINYPKNKLEIHVLDDSTDETQTLVKQLVTNLKNENFDIKIITRPNRIGYKAGALANATINAKGQFIAIFDADFIINPNFLLETLPYFQDSEIGMVQTKWLHLNENFSLLTQLQAFGLDAHFSIDQVGRNIGGYFSNFNGTGGIWRKICIEQTGGWQADCLTEDLDLSYRAQIKGWKFVYLENTGNLAELPVEIKAVKSQQFRWAKGAAECARKLLLGILGDKKISIGKKIHAFFHLMNSATYLSLMLTALLLLPIIFIQEKYPELKKYLNFAQYFQLSFVFLGIYFWVSYRKKSRNILKFIAFYPRFLAFMMGLSLYNSVGVFQGYFGKKTAFVRTPKFNINTKLDSWKNNKYVNSQFDYYFIIESILFIYFAASLLYVIINQQFGAIPFLAMLVFGYGSVVGYGLFHRFLIELK